MLPMACPWMITCAPTSVFGLSNTGFMSVWGAIPQAMACAAWSRPISPPSAVTAELSAMFCGLKGATRTPFRTSHRHSAATNVLLPASEVQPCTMSIRAVTRGSLSCVPGQEVPAIGFSVDFLDAIQECGRPALEGRGSICREVELGKLHAAGWIGVDHQQRQVGLRPEQLVLDAIGAALGVELGAVDHTVGSPPGQVNGGQVVHGAMDQHVHVGLDTLGVALDRQRTPLGALFVGADEIVHEHSTGLLGQIHHSDLLEA